MTISPRPHLSADDLDASHFGTLSAWAMQHIDICDACREMVRSDHALVRALEALPTFPPPSGFEDRIMARVRIHQPERFPALAAAWRRIAAQPPRYRIAASVAVGMGASTLWTLANQDLMTALGNRVLAEGTRLAWVGVQTVAANLTAQPWFEQAQALLGTPARLAAVLAGTLVAYLGGLVALRRLVALPSQAAPNANW